jgi:hypothetical protein
MEQAGGASCSGGAVRPSGFAGGRSAGQERDEKGHCHCNCNQGENEREIPEVGEKNGTKNKKGENHKTRETKTRKKPESSGQKKEIHSMGMMSGVSGLRITFSEWRKTRIVLKASC